MRSDSGRSAGRQIVGVAAFDVARVDSALAGTVFHGKLHHFGTIDSTQALAIADAHNGLEGGQVYVADEQTAGRGRGGHMWHSEPGSGIYVTVLMRPSLRAEDALAISLAAGLAAQTAIEKVIGLQIALRWPNDLVTLGPGSLKLGGILTETAMKPDGRLRYAAIGVGVNLNQSVMPAELQDVSASLRMIAGASVSREDLLVALLPHLEVELQTLLDARSQVLARFAERSSWVRGKRVRVAESGGYTGVTDGLTESGLLRVRCEDGSQHVVRHGGVRETL